MNYYTLAQEYAQDAWDEAVGNLSPDSPTTEDLREAAEQYLWESLDGCEHVIYTHKAWQLCADLPTGDGEDWLGDQGSDHLQDGIDSLISRLAFAVLLLLAQEHLADLIEEHEAELG